jgi:predicted dehydrogenase
MCIPLLSWKNIRWDLSLAGGTLMDVGCYTIHLLRTLAGAEPVVRSAKAKLFKPGVDRWMQVEFEFADGRTGSITASMLSSRLLSAGARVIGSRGELRVNNPSCRSSCTASSSKHKPVVAARRYRPSPPPTPRSWSASPLPFSEVYRFQPMWTMRSQTCASSTLATLLQDCHDVSQLHGHRS